MIEDLVANTRDEPYRLFTARSENRLFIREDNSILRMKPYRQYLFLQKPLDAFLERFSTQVLILSKICDEFMFSENSETLLKFSQNSENKLSRAMTLSELLKQAWLNPITTLMEVLHDFEIEFDYDIVRTVAIDKKYAGYIQRFDDQNEKIKKMDATLINWAEIIESKNVSFECRHRISKIKPETFGQLKRIEGIRPATLAVVASKAL
jgi:tRNA uridine 5-carboxymethylaminomethyl modification enzyme